MHVFIEPETNFPLPANFDYEGYIETEQEFWALFPETEGKRVNFCQLGLTARLYTECPEAAGDTAADETWFLMPCSDRSLRPVRMRAMRPLSLEEFRLAHHTAIRLMSRMAGTGHILDEIHLRVLGEEILAAGQDLQ
jgi:hypothetical protein